MRTNDVYRSNKKMARKCSIKGCDDEFQNAKGERRNLFKFPSDEEMKNKWLKSIGHNLKEGRPNRKNLYICNVHFEENCFYDNVLTTLKDGCEITLPRKIFTLKKDSIPSIFKDGFLKPKEELTVTNIKAESQLTITNKRHKQRDLSPVSKRRVDDSNQVMSLLHSDSVDKSTVKPPFDYSPDLKYSKATLVKEWNERDTSQFPNHWEMHDNTNGVLFVCIGDVEGMVSRSIFVKDDMTTEIRAHNYPAKFPVFEKISCLEDLRKATINLVCLNICEMALKGLCKNGFFIPKRSYSKKCKDCQVIRERENRKKRRLAVKSKKQKKKIIKIKEELSRATNEIDTMQENLSNSKAQDSVINEEGLNNEIKEPQPLLQVFIKSEM